MTNNAAATGFESVKAAARRNNLNAVYLYFLIREGKIAEHHLLRTTLTKRNVPRIFVSTAWTYRSAVHDGKVVGTTLLERFEAKLDEILELLRATR